MSVMKPIYSEAIPISKDFSYEVKYDGYRALLYWTENGIKIKSRNQNDFTDQFPEIIHYCKKIQTKISAYLPILLDGEIVILNNPYQANFSLLQQRGRLKNSEKINNFAVKRPATFMVFDLLEANRNTITRKSYEKRKALLENLFETIEISDESRFQIVESFKNHKQAWKNVFHFKGEGIVAKRNKSTYQKGKSHHDWFKTKNWRTVHAFLITYNPKNGYFTAGVYEGEQVYIIGKCKHGLIDEGTALLKDLFLTKGKVQTDGSHVLPPAICASIHTLDFIQNEFREPEFVRLLPNERAKDCTAERLKLDLALFPTTFEYTKTEKVFWPKINMTKGDLLIYLRNISPYMLPFLQERALTIIRCPDGVAEESFFQKSLPSYAPSFIKSVRADDKNMMICDQLDSLLWFANHGAIEYHVPFQKLSSIHPIEIAFDLDPPDRGKFHLAIKAALLIKRLLDDLRLVSFIKTSGNKGLQIHIPIHEGSMTYEQTAKFTKAVALTIENEAPTSFTTERLKKNRGDRLYIDYVQHGKNKTLISPYSPRKTDDATVATPLFWEEVNEKLTPDQFTITNVVERVEALGCPFANYTKVGKAQKLDNLLKLIE